MDSHTVREILFDMIQSLDEFKCEGNTYYKKQVSRIINYVKKLEKEREE